MITRIAFLFSGLIFLMLSSGSSCAKEPFDAIYVAADSPASQPDGLTWATAYKEVQQAVERAKEIRTLEPDRPIVIAVKAGEYHPNDKYPSSDWGDETKVQALVDISGLANIELLGGFEGNCACKDDQKPHLYASTILSGKLRDWKATSGVLENARHVVFIDHKNMKFDKPITIKGFRILDGKSTMKAAAVPSSNEGGGLYVNAAAMESDKPSVILEHLDIVANEALYGGGLLVERGAFVLARNLNFKENSSLDFGGAIGNYGVINFEKGSLVGNESNFGGGLSSHGVSTLINIKITDSNKGNAGAGIYNSEGGQLTVTGGEISGSEGIGLFNRGVATVRGANFFRNKVSSVGAAIFNEGTLNLFAEDKDKFSGNMPNQEHEGFQGLYNQSGGKLNIP